MIAFTKKPPAGIVATGCITYCACPSCQERGVIQVARWETLRESAAIIARGEGRQATAFFILEHLGTVREGDQVSEALRLAVFTRKPQEGP